MADNDRVQLGFALPLHAGDDNSVASDCPPKLGHKSPRWSDWDGGKAGGRPSWLNPRDLPRGPLRCRGPCRGGGGKEGAALRFVAQLYCPADDATGNDAAFHRSLYVFACPVCCAADKPVGDASTSDVSSRLSGCVRVLRCQLPKRNDFYPATGDEDDDGWTKHTSEHWAEATGDDKLHLCAVCGQRGKGKCPKQQRWFCGPEHQKECLRASKQQKEPHDGSEGDISLRYLPSVCYDSELVVEEEPSADATDSAESKATTDSANALFPSKDFADADADLEQHDLNALTGNTDLATAARGVTDPTTLAFYARIAIGGKENNVRDQCLRYCRWPKNASEGTGEASEAGDEDREVGPLWISSDNRPPAQASTSDSDAPSFPPPCQYCGAPRKFEFQLLPQMLHYLLHDPDKDSSVTEGRQVLTESERAVLLEAKSKIESGVELPEGFLEQHEAAVASARNALLGISSDKCSEGSKRGLDWGTVAVYTCTASCGNGKRMVDDTGAYMEEAAWVQPPLD